MPPVKRTDAIAEKWARVTPERAADYKAGVEDPRRDWADGATKAEPAYESGVTGAIREKRYSKGVRRVGTAGWQRKAATKGADRFGPGVRDAAKAYEDGFAPYREVIERTTLPARGAKGDPKNLDRVRVMATALHDAKVKGT
jgi:hypothetical protein